MASFMTTHPDQDEPDIDDADDQPDELVERIAGATMYCARCGYNLTGVQSETCPECGNELDYEDVTSVTLETSSDFSRAAKSVADKVVDFVGPLLGWGVIVFFSLAAVMLVVMIFGTFVTKCQSGRIFPG